MQDVSNGKDDKGLVAKSGKDDDRDHGWNLKFDS